MHVFTLVEIDVDVCGHTYGLAPCTAAIGRTGPQACFDTLSTCQDRENFSAEPVTLRFAESGAVLGDIDAIPSLKSVSFTPATVLLGEDLGQRASLTATFTDHRWGDAAPGFDKYHATRDYDPYGQGTFWGKFRARQPYLRGRPMRVIRGSPGQALEDMDTRHYAIEAFDGPRPDGTFTITAKDVLKALDGDRAQAPRLSRGFLVAAITAEATELRLGPSRVGDIEYPASGHVAIGGREICAFTRAGDVMTITRAQFNTEVQAHDESDRVQLCLYYRARDPADIVSDLMQTYAGIPASYVPIASWRNETMNWLARAYTAMIAEPVPVKDLVSELVEQAALAIWWDDEMRRIRLQALRGIPTDAGRHTPDTILAGSLKSREQPTRRLSRVQTYFGQINPLKPLDDRDNYRSSALSIDAPSERAWASPAIKTILSRWIPQFARPNALRLNEILLSRFKVPPRRFAFALHRDPAKPAPVRLGGGYRLEAHTLQDASGAAVDVPVQVTRLGGRDDRFEVEAEEMLFETSGELEPGLIIIDTNVDNVNLRDVYDTIYPAPQADTVVTCIIEAGVVVGSDEPGRSAFDTGTWPAGTKITIIVQGYAETGDNGEPDWRTIAGPVIPASDGALLIRFQPFAYEGIRGRHGTPSPPPRHPHHDRG